MSLSFTLFLVHLHADSLKNILVIYLNTDCSRYKWKWYQELTEINKQKEYIRFRHKTHSGSQGSIFHWHLFILFLPVQCSWLIQTLYIYICDLGDFKSQNRGLRKLLIKTLIIESFALKILTSEHKAVYQYVLYLIYTFVQGMYHIYISSHNPIVLILYFHDKNSLLGYN